MSSVKWRPVCLGLNVLITQKIYTCITANNDTRCSKQIWESYWPMPFLSDLGWQSSTFSKTDNNSISLIEPRWCIFVSVNWVITGSNNDFVACLAPKKSYDPMLTYCQLDPKEHISIKFYLKFKNFIQDNAVWKCCLQNVGHFVSASMC